jgi:glucose/arabinose dehydrogenase
VTLWNGTPGAQRVIRLDPADIPTDPDALAAFTPEPFVTGLIRPVDVTVGPDGTLLVADFIYGFVWRVTWTGIVPTPPTPTTAPFVFATNTPQP